MTESSPAPASEPVPAPPAPPAPPAEPAPPAVGWVAPQLPVRAQSPFRSASTRARWVLGLLIANVVASIVAVGISLWGKTLIADFEAGAATISDIETFDSVHALIGITQTVLFVAAGIAWLAWSSRTVDNEDALGIGPSDTSPNMVMVWWFVPLANFVMVPTTHGEMYRRYHRGVTSSAAIVYVWFVVYLLNSFLAYVVGAVWTDADDFAEFQEGLNLWIVSDLLTAISAVLAIVLVRRIQTRADLLAISGAPASPAVPPAPEPDPAS